MRLGFAFSVPLLTLLACTGTSHGPTSATSEPTHARPSASSPHVTATNAANWPSYHGNALRSGHAPTMAAASGPLRIAKRYSLDGDVYASPLVIGGRVVVATENDSVYAIQNGH